MLPFHAAGFAILNWEGFIKILQALIISPFLALAVGFLMMSLFKVLFKNDSLHGTNKDSVYSKSELLHYNPLRTVRMMHKKQWVLLQWL